MKDKLLKAIARISRRTNNFVARVKILDTHYDLFIYRHDDGLYSVDFGGRFGDLESLANLLSKFPGVNLMD